MRIYKWILHPSLHYDVLTLPSPNLNAHLINQPHYCLPNAVPASLRGDEAEEEEEEEEESEAEGANDDDEDNDDEGEQIQVREIRSKRVEERGEMSASSSSRSPRAPTPPQPSFSPTHYPTHFPDPHGPMPSMAYFDQRFDHMMTGQQLLMECMASMHISMNEQHDHLLYHIQGLEQDHAYIQGQHSDIKNDIHNLWHAIDEGFGHVPPQGSWEAHSPQSGHA